MTIDKEQTQLPQGSFREIVDFLENQSGISRPDRRSRSVLIQKQVYITGPNIDAYIKQPLPLHIQVSQGLVVNKWADEVQISITAPIPNPLKGQPTEHNIGYPLIIKANEQMFGTNKYRANIELRGNKPFVKISFNPANDLGRSMGGTEIGSSLGLDKQKWVPSMRNKHGIDLPPYTTNDAGEAAKIGGFILRAGSHK